MLTLCPGSCASTPAERAKGRCFWCPTPPIEATPERIRAEFEETKGTLDWAAGLAAGNFAALARHHAEAGLRVKWLEQDEAAAAARAAAEAKEAARLEAEAAAREAYAREEPIARRAAEVATARAELDRAEPGEARAAAFRKLGLIERKPLDVPLSGWLARHGYEVEKAEVPAGVASADVVQPVALPERGMVLPAAINRTGEPR
jgi:hypothetical protein